MAGPVQRAQFRIASRVAAALLAVAAGNAAGAELTLPEGATLAREIVDPSSSYAMPTGPWDEAGGVMATEIAGRVTRQAWRIGGTVLTSFEIMATLRGQLARAGYDILFDCKDETCGGFDFRYGTEVIGEPDMHVDLRDFYFAAAQRPGATTDAVSLMVSRSASAGFVQVIAVGDAEAAPVALAPTASTKAEPGAAMPTAVLDDIGEAMETVGRFVMVDLDFATGSAELGPGDYTSLAELAAYLAEHPEKRVALVGHTDAEGSLAGNISLSKRRAASIADRLATKYGVNRDQLEAEGIGYLAPIASNQTDEGRTLNRRVEAILVSTE